MWFVGGYVLELREIAEKSLVDHLLKDGNRLEEGVQPARRGGASEINPGGLCCLLDSPQAEFQSVVQIHVHVGVLGPPMGFDPSGRSQWGRWAKIHGTHNAPFFPTGEFNLSLLEKYRIFDLVVVGNGELLMLACSNMHVFEGLSIFGNASSTDFGISYGFVTPIKGCKVTDSFMSLAGFEFAVDVYG